MSSAPGSNQARAARVEARVLSGPFLEALPSARLAPAISHASRPPASSPKNRLFKGLMAADRLVRLHFLATTHNLVLLGAAGATELAGRATPSFGVLLQLLVVGWLFHGFAYVFNDVVDLPIDRTQPRRAADPLVRGELDVRWVLAGALLTMPAAAFQTYCLGGGLVAQAVLLASFALMACYNVWGKRCFFPPLTDLAQGLGWGGLVLWAGLCLSGGIDRWTLLAALWAATFILLINGLHGGLRDLENDLRTGSRTTAIFFGARPQSQAVGAAQASMTGSLRTFAILGQAAVLAVSAVAWWFSAFSWLSTLVLGVLAGFNLVLLGRVLQVDRPTWQRDFRLHLFFLHLLPLGAVLPWLSPSLLAVLLGAFVAPIPFFDISRELARAGWARLRA